MKSAEEIARELGGARKDGNGWKCLCPVHDDHHSSLHISQAEDGGFLAHCFAGCDSKTVWQTIRDRCGLNGERHHDQPHGTYRAFLSPSWPDPSDLKLLQRNPSDFWVYESEGGTPLMIVARYEDGGRKTIRPWRWNGAAWESKALDAPRPLYGLRKLAADHSKPVLLVEGEKTATAASRLFPDYVCMCWSGGADGIKHSDWTPLRGRSVTLWADHDAPGMKAMNEAGATLLQLGCRIRHVEHDPEWPKAWDVADADWTPTQADEYLTQHVGAYVVPQDVLPFVWAGDIDHRKQPAHEIAEDLLTAGGMSVVYGDSNSGKTYVVMDLGMSIAREVVFLGKRTRRGAVIYVAGEGAQSIEHRILAYRIRHQISDMPFGVVKTGLDLRSDDTQAKLLMQLIEIKSEQIGCAVSMIVFDTLARAMAGGNENSPEDMGMLVRHSDMIRAKTGAHVLWVHHTGKDLLKGARGHSSLRAATDTELEVSHDEASGARVLKVTKQRDLSSVGMELAGKLIPVELGIFDCWGRAVTACVVDGMDVPDREKAGPKGNVQRIILTLITDRGGKMAKKDLRDMMQEIGIGRSSVFMAIKSLVADGVIDDGMSMFSLVQCNK
jgi:hypothetical protein